MDRIMVFLRDLKLNSSSFLAFPEAREGRNALMIQRETFHSRIQQRFRMIHFNATKIVAAYF